MDRIVLGILLIVIVLALAIFVYYQMLDRKKFMAAAHFVNALDEPLGEWLSEALSDPDGPPEEDDLRRRLADCLAKYDETKPMRCEQKTLLLNEAHGLLKMAYASGAEHPQTEAWKDRRNERIEEALEQVNLYNHYVRGYNRSLETRTGAVVADLLHLKHLTVLKDLRL
ncbi:MAG: hypothetical protein IKH56_00655 [Oscillospiraceae bacterium]|nr:hypothetical protein [Oscillospiraceae bacterium]